MKKRIAALMILAAMLLTLPACTKTPPVNQPDSANQPADTNQPTANDTPALSPDVPVIDAPSDVALTNNDALTSTATDVPASDSDIPPEYAGRTVIQLGVREAERIWSGVTPGGNTIFARIRDFNDAQDEIYVEIKAYIDPNSPTEYPSEERLYAELVTGKHCDLYFTGWRDFNTDLLNNAGLIQDWKPVLDADPDFHPEEYMTHIWQLMEQPDGAMYDLCLCFTTPSSAMSSGPRELLGDRDYWTYEEYLAYLDEHNYSCTQRYILSVEHWFYVDWMDLNTMTCDFDDPSFYDWLAFLKAFPVEQKQSAARYDGEILQGIRSHGKNWADTGEWRRYRGMPGRYENGPEVSLLEGIALATTTEHLDACLTFVKWLLSYDSQMEYHARTYQGFPVRNDVFEEALRRAQLPGDDEDSLFLGMRINSTIKIDGNTVDGKVGDPFPGLPDEEVAYLRQLVAGLNRRDVYWEDAYFIFTEEVQAYLAGDITDEQCAERLQKRFTIFLAERQ